MYRLVTLLIFMSVGIVVDSLDIPGPPDLQRPTPSDIPEFYYKHTRLTLPCLAGGGPDIRYTWLRDGQVVNSSRPGLEEGPDGNLTFTSASAQEEGLYQCRASNRWGTALSAVFRLTMARFDSNVGTTTHTIQAQRGGYVKITPSHIPSSPPARVTWTRGSDRELLSLGRRLIQDLEGALHITNVTDIDATITFTDLASNDRLGAQKYCDTTRILLREGAEVPRLPVLRYPGPDVRDNVVVALQGDVLRLQCIFSGNLETRWEYPVSQVKGYTERAGTILVIPDVGPEDGGRYTCEGINSMGRTQHTFNVDIQARPTFTSGSWRPGKLITTEGDDVTISCDVTARPPPTIRWFSNGEALTGKLPHPRMSVSEDGRALTIRGLDKEADRQVFQCNVSNVHGEVYVNVPLYVLKRTVISSPLHDVILSANVTVTSLTCNATTDPDTPLTFTWTKDGRPLLFYDDPRLVAEAGRLTVNLTGLEERALFTYRGRYTCTASNGVSTATATAHVTVNSTLSPIDDKAVLAVGAGLPWWVYLVVGGVGLLLLGGLITCGVLRARRNRGGKYPVGRLERKAGFDALVDMEEEGFRNYQRPTPKLARMESICSLDSGVGQSTTTTARGTPSLGMNGVTDTRGRSTPTRGTPRLSMSSENGSLFTFTLPLRGHHQLRD